MARASPRVAPNPLAPARRVVRRVAAHPTRASPASTGPSSSRVARHYVNLKNGIEALPTLVRELGVRDHGYCRVQSSLLEAGNVERMLSELDAALLLDLALGRAVFVWDLGSRDVVKGRGNPRALWYGLEFVRYALRKMWFPDTDVARDAIAVTRGKRVDKEWDRRLSALDRSTKRKLRYYAQFIPEHVTDVRLIGVYRATTHDDDAAFYRDVLHANELENPRTEATAPRSETETIEAIRALSTDGGFNLFFSGAEEPVWLNQITGGGRVVDVESDEEE